MTARDEQTALLREIRDALVARPSLPEESLSTVSSGQTGHPEIIIDQGKTYTRQTHPALFRVVDLLADHKEHRAVPVRQLETLSGVGKSWCAVAKRYWLEHGSEEI